MGTWATAKRSEINDTFEAGSGDMVGETEPVSIWRRSGSPKDATIKGTITRVDGTLRFAYSTHGEALETADVWRIFSIAYLDQLTMHYYQEKTTRVEIVESASGATHGDRYPDPE